MDASEPIELERVGGARSLLHELESALAGEISAADLYRSLVPSKDVFLNILSFKVRVQDNDGIFYAAFLLKIEAYSIQSLLITIFDCRATTLLPELLLSLAPCIQLKVWSHLTKCRMFKKSRSLLTN